jgi:hypothetical protein
MPDENHFLLTIMVDSDIDLPLVVDALNTVSVNYIAASLVSVDLLYNLTSLKPLTRLTEALVGIQV